MTAHRTGEAPVTRATCRGCREYGADRGPEIRDLLGHDSIGHTAANSLIRDHINTVAKLRTYSDSELIDVRYFGSACLARVREFIPAPENEAERNRHGVRAAIGEQGAQKRAATFLINAGYDTVDKIAAAPDEDLLDILNFGPALLAAVRAVIPARTDNRSEQS